MYKVADSHVHIYAPKIAAKATQGIQEFYEFSKEVDEGCGTHDHLYEVCKEGGISYAAICQVALSPQIVDTINAFLMGLYRQHPEFYVPIAAIHPLSENKPALVEKLQKEGFFGIKLHPDYQKFNMDDPAMYDFYDAAGQLHMPVLIHTGDRRFDYSNPCRLKNILTQFPHLTAIGAHFGGYSQWDIAYECLWNLPNLLMDTSSALEFMDPAFVRKFIDRFGKERFLFGSDYPLISPPDELKKFLQLGLSDDINKAILYDNFARLYQIDQPNKKEVVCNEAV